MSVSIELNADIIDDIHKLRDYARANPLPYESMQARIAGDLPPIGDDSKHTLIVPVDFKCCYSVEPTRDNVYLMQHLSVSYIGTQYTDYPPIKSIEILMGLFGFKGTLKSPGVICYPESEVSDSKVMAVNIIEQLGYTRKLGG